jgi:catechol 2,3-dioxygenase-like lactoylglutathione lyase family enzyme
MAKSVRFHRDGLRFRTEEKDDSPAVIFFNTPGTKFELYPLGLLAEDISKESPPEIGHGFGGVTLAYNVERKDEVDEVIALARSVGARIVKEPQDVFWGGYHAYFADPDGYYWEVVWGPMFKFDDKGMLVRDQYFSDEVSS